jgi:YfiH family protein
MVLTFNRLNFLRFFAIPDMQSPPINAENLAALAGVRHAFFTREWGNAGFSGESFSEETGAQGAIAVRRRMAHYLNVDPLSFMTCHQIHSPDVVTVAQIWKGQENPQADALVTNKPGVALGVLTADCVPVLFADINARVIGAAHAGWRGAISGVIENTVEAMEKLGAARTHIHAALGPSIWQNSYEVGPEFPAPFLAENPGNEKFFRPAFKSDRMMFDLPGYVAAKLRALGLGSVEPSPADTCADPGRFYSHRYSTLRNEKREGNLMSAIALV